MIVGVSERQCYRISADLESDLGLCSSFNILLSCDLAGLWESFLYAECLMSMSAPSARANLIKD